MKPIVLIALGTCWAAVAAGQPDVNEIVHRSSAAMEMDWKAAPNFSYQERDVESKHGGAKTVKTHQVLMIDGSQYNRLIAINDRPLTPQEEAREQQKLRREIRLRRSQPSDERQERISKYQKERQQDHAMMMEMTIAFGFRLLREDVLNGHPVWVLAATPKPGYQPKSRDTKVLTGMRGTLWIDKQHYQWVKVEAEVIHPVSFYGFLAKVAPGTKFMLEQAPVSGNIWQPVRFSSTVNATALGFWDESSTDDESYRDYKPMAAVLAQLHAEPEKQ
jgi:hypothetical protein